MDIRSIGVLDTSTGTLPTACECDTNRHTPWLFSKTLDGKKEVVNHARMTGWQNSLMQMISQLIRHTFTRRGVSDHLRPNARIETINKHHQLPHATRGGWLLLQLLLQCHSMNLQMYFLHIGCNSACPNAICPRLNAAFKSTHLNPHPPVQRLCGRTPCSAGTAGLSLAEAGAHLITIDSSSSSSSSSMNRKNYLRNGEQATMHKWPPPCVTALSPHPPYNLMHCPTFPRP
jgi:hypothetical protein